jgi:phosphoglycerol geranylgeranyltransferase
MNTYNLLMQIKTDKAAGHLVLIDPDKKPVDEWAYIAQQCEQNGVDGLLIGGSLLFSTAFDAFVQKIKEAVSIPVILFPGNGQQVSGHADAILFMTLISGRNPQYLIGEHVHSAPVIHALRLETIPTGYMLIESGKSTAAEFMSGTRPIPRHKPEIAVAHALAGQMLGLKMLYLEAGSGAEQPVPDAMIAGVCRTIEIPVIVGGGIREPEIAAQKVKAGASFIVTGTFFESSGNLNQLGEFAAAIHQSSI